ncbi:uncharacterized protein L969DRAFT_93876 [Mixia osmundae IAM 14324]|uniref:Uncharacterized protein n=1 Tax=Mixia osmundae (strain CBS 9802 / IAM 14324 / JCM 22182 / KY 12970) TaxID=764103 RepID=G7E9U5_MIXOS|nr:uncharacterized protein L969DRAFT_93876 [Mixia osmundae IAM 14324]KEI40047.1 hypothetical protein L969DRAFT_93876 [Mixia osmundae IAM 14324]GAA99414.1 hypothetical protein E5Q_06112 [Mixia osmundae IAM 14324]
MEESLLEASTSYDASDTAPNRLRERFPIPVRRRQYNMTHSVRGSCYKSDHTIYSTVAAHGQVVLKTNKQGDKYYPDVETNPGPGMFGMRVVEEEPGGNAVRVAFIMQLKSSTPGWSSCCTTYYTWIGWFSWRIMAVSFNEIAMYQYCFPHHLADANRDKCDAVVIVTLGNPPGVTKCNIALSEETCDQCDENTAW